MAEQGQKTTKERISKHTLKAKLKHAQPHSKRYEQVAEKIDANKTYSLAEAIELVKTTATTKFDSSVEFHLHLTAKKGKKGAEDEYARGVLHLPHGTGKTPKVVILTE